MPEVFYDIRKDQRISNHDFDLLRGFQDNDNYAMTLISELFERVRTLEVLYDEATKL